ncbi:helix-turn-helix transcriptional regulator [Streptomyces sp. MI02-7b]|uniref:helix-turn-helix domain-containing protein n=1 Tax=Streptomyces sp. MI02-7b TaxID=462941 RepID=UPI0029A70FA2|nr:helix-turn-helix transcriptional regulator [Streptomyces sp. MI02-7b]MDX3077877.1 helix-turn-helix transcriptional regulator [Streptomyces sp. MI02-7b]
MAAVTPLGEFLQSRRRAAAVPSDVARTRRRRVSGLRREEVAARASVSVNYYVRLEQGREKNPSMPVIAALSSALGLDSLGREHLELLARPQGVVYDPAAVAAALPDLSHLVREQLSGPALVMDAWGDILAWNDSAQILYGMNQHGGNIISSIFLDAESHSLYGDWKDAARCAAGTLRDSWARFPQNPRFGEVFEALRFGSDIFRDIWDEYPVVRKSSGFKMLTHPLVGNLELSYQALEPPQAPGLQLISYRPSPTAGVRALESYRRLMALAGDAHTVAAVSVPA